MKPVVVARSRRIVVLPLLLAAWMLPGLVQTHATVVVGPFLEGVTTTNAYVLVECDSTATMTNYYGTTTSYGSVAATAFTKTSSGSYVVHRIKLTDLTPDTLYHYQLAGQGFPAADYTFRTLVNPGTSFRFAWQADFRDGTSVHNAIAARILTNAQPLFVLEGGDTCEPPDWATWHSEYFSANEKELGKWMPIYPSPGNHEGWGTLTQSYYQSPDSTGTNGYYSFDCGDVHVTMANRQLTYPIGSAQYNWIQQDVQSSLKPWKIFGTHYPAYCAGGHGEDAASKTVTSNILEPNAVKVYLGGHSHFYQHNLVNGIRHLVVGAAGAPLTAPTTAAYTIKSAQTNCYLVADVSATNLHMVVYNDVGAVLDTIDLYKLSAPTGLAATPGPEQVTLNWDAVAGATSNTVWYGTNLGGPYPTKRSVTGATTTTVTGLAGGTTYYFVATASDTNGPSAISTEVSATPTNPPPVVTLTSPVDGATYIAPATISLSAVVTTNGNTINRVQFYSNTTNFIGEAAVPPYEFVWPDVSAGSYSLLARVVYNGSSTADSTAATVTVDYPPPVISSLGVLSDGSFTLSGTGVARRSYVLLTASNLVPPLVWTPLATNPADDQGVFGFTDTEVTNYWQRYYRVGTP